MEICNYINNPSFECEFSSGKANGFGVFKSSKKMVKGIYSLKLYKVFGTITCWKEKDKNFVSMVVDILDNS